MPFCYITRKIINDLINIIQDLVFPTPFTSVTAPEYLTKIAIQTPTNTECIMNLYSIAVADDASQINVAETEILRYYLYDFDAYSREMVRTLSYEFDRSLPAWSATDLYAQVVPMVWSKSIVHDLDNDGQYYEYRVEYFDGEEKGSFENHVNDLILYDFTNEEFKSPWFIYNFNLGRKICH